MWNAETYNNSKFIMDMIYCKMYIHPRNKLYTDEPKEYIDFRKFGDKLFGDSATYYLLRIHTMYDHMSWLEYIHSQEPNDMVRDSTCTIMDDKYAHNDKKISISRTVIKPDQFEVIEGIEVRHYEKSNKLGFTFSKNK